MKQGYFAIVSGEYRGLLAGAARGVLWLLSVPYGLVVRLRNKLYDWQVIQSHRAKVPVVCVGNISCGGTGKTPMVIALVKMLEELGHRPGILTRGYKGSSAMPADEVLLFSKALPSTPVIVGIERVAAAARAVREHGVDVLVMDDGFGHRRLERDLDIVLLGEPREQVCLLPRGLYREPASSLERADVLIKTYEQNGDPRGHHAFRRAKGLVCSSGQMGLNELANKQVLAFCAIAEPGSFERSLSRAGVKVVIHKHYADHYRYGQRDLEELAELARQEKCALSLTTMKDWVKIEHDKLRWPGGADSCLCALDIEMSFDEETRELLRNKFKYLFIERPV